MSIKSVQSEGKRAAYRMAVEIALVAAVFAAIATGCLWMFMSEHSPLNHGERPDTTGWLMLNIPAFYLFMALFGKHGGETNYFLCVFAQWLVLGTGVGVFVAVARRSFKDI